MPALVTIENDLYVFLIKPSQAKEFLHSLRVSSAIMSSIKNKVLNAARILPTLSIKSYKQLPGSIE